IPTASARSGCSRACRASSGSIAGGSGEASSCASRCSADAAKAGWGGGAGRGEGGRARRIRRAAQASLAAEIPDPKLRERLTPDYAPGCKRLLISDDYIPALRRENVAVVTSSIERIAEGRGR